MQKRVLIIPDCFYNGASGALAAVELGRLLVKSGAVVGVFTPDERKGEETYAIQHYHRSPFAAMDNYFESRARSELERVADDFKPTHVFSIGGVINRPLVYFDVIRERNTPHIYLIFCQDFYCTRIHAALPDGPCLRCLHDSKLQAFVHRCAVKTNRNKAAFLVNNTLIRQRLGRCLKNLTFVLGSTEEQLAYYHAFGVAPEKTRRCPLFFPPERLKGIAVEKGDYFAIAGQARTEKGIHLLQHILPYCPGVRIKIAFSRRLDGEHAMEHHGLRRFVESGQLQPVYETSWRTGLRELYAGSRGILITSIWPTTTEYAFLEALGLGKPVVAFDVGIHREAIVHGLSGFKVPVNDFRGFANCINNLQELADLSTISAGAWELYRQLNNEPNYLAVLESVLN